MNLEPGSLVVGAAATTAVVLLGACLFLLARLRRLLARLDGTAPSAVVAPVAEVTAEASASGRELAGMLEKLDDAQRLNARQYRLQRTLFELFKRMRGDQDPETLAASILDFIGETYRAPVGAFYLARPGQRLVLAARYGGTDEGEPPAELRTGQGAVGRAAAQRRIQVLKDPEQWAGDWPAAIGGSAVGCMVVAPFHLAGQVKGVVQLALVGGVDEAELDFLGLGAESVAMALDSARSRARVHRLLEETRRQAAALSRQQKELQATNEELARTDRYKSEFLANMSHELRTPLNSMLIMSQVLAENREGRLSDDEVDAAETIGKAGGELLVIINDILDMSRVEAGELELHVADTEPRRLADDLIDLFKPGAERAGLCLEQEVWREVPEYFPTDQLRVGQILKNLLNNAIKFTEEGQITLTVRRPLASEMPELGANPEEWLAFAVSDTGIGMSAETAARVFEVFNQGDGSIGRRYGGSGLGLSISRRLAELMDGWITVDSEEGVGSTFTLILPTAAAPEILPDEEAPRAAAAPVSAETGSGLLAGRTALLVDDDMRTVFGLSRQLDGLEARVMIARDRDEAAAHLAEGPDPDLVFVEPRLYRDAAAQLECLIAADRAGGPRAAVFLGGPGPADWAATPCLAKPVAAAALAQVCAELLPAATEPARTAVHERMTG